MTTSLNEINRTLGTMMGKLDALGKEIGDIRDDMKDSEDKSDVSRATVHRRLDEVVVRTGYLESDMKAVKNDMQTVKTVTDDVTRWKQAGMGALAVTGLASSALTAILLSYGSEIVKMIRGN
ncbi:DUF1515 family protein [Aminobacter sp. UC22_36]|uniref:DUF1515 family protein n=1 Tax=Aminobacter sp. UC22_36 TaxID=3374549 RepID=UPI0037570904